MRSTRAPARPLVENSLSAAAKIRSRVRFGSRTTTRRWALRRLIVVMGSNRIDTNLPGTSRQAGVRRASRFGTWSEKAPQNDAGAPIYGTFVGSPIFAVLVVLAIS